MRLLQINLPLTDNNGQGTEVLFQTFEEKICAVAGGLTLWEGQGAWIDDTGCLYNEPVHIYQVAYSDMTVALRILDAARECARAYNQKALFYVIDSHVVIQAL